MRPSATQGQASVELVGLLPLVIAVALATFHVLAAGAAHEAADGAAEAGAIALLQDADPRSAARDALPEWARERTEISLRGRSVRVIVRPRGLVPAITRELETTSTASAGPEPRSVE